MNILQFADFVAPYEGNFLLSLKYLEKNFNSGKFVYLFTKNAANCGWVKDLNKVYFLENSILKNIKIFIKIIKNEQIDIIHTHFSIFKYDVALKIARMFSKKTIYIRHMHMIYKNKKSAIAEQIKRLVSNADKEIACGIVTYNAMILAGFSKKKVELIENGMDFSRLDTFKPMEKIPTNLLMFGYNYYTKGVDIAVCAVAKIPKATLYIVASKTDELSKQIVKDYGEIPKNVKFLPPINDVATYFKMCNIFISASREESFCYATKEAAYCGCLVVASDILAHRNVNEKFRFQSENSNDLARVLAYALEFSESTNINPKAAENAIEKYSLEKWKDKIFTLYNNLQ